MSIIYALIARSSEVVLCEYTEYAGNFQQISRILLRKIKKGSKYSIEYDKQIEYRLTIIRYKFHYMNENDLTYLCMTEGGQEELAFAYLAEIKKKFIYNYDYDKIAGFYAYQLEEFVPTLKQLMVI